MMIFLDFFEFHKNKKYKYLHRFFQDVHNNVISTRFYFEALWA